MIIAGYLGKNSFVKKVYYPGLESHPGFEIARKQMRAFGGILSFELDKNKVNPEQFLRNLKMIRPALSLGGVETIVCAPAVTSHEKITETERAQLGITDSLLRLSVGVEDTDDIIADLAQAM
jgi:cystathionine beta-lyase